MGQDVNFLEKAVGGGGIVVTVLGEDGSPSAPGDVGKTDMVTDTQPPEEESDPERPCRREVRGEIMAHFIQISGIETEGQGMFLRDKEVRLEGMEDE